MWPRHLKWLLAFQAVALGMVCTAIMAGAPEHGLSQASPLLQLTEETYHETYSPDSGRDPLFVNSRAIVGLHLGHANGRFRVDQMMAALSSRSAATQFCVRLLSDDANYRSLNNYKRATTPNGPRKIETRSRFGQELTRRYSSDEIVIKISASQNCAAPVDQELVAAIPPGAKDADTLIVFVNAVGSRASVSLINEKSTAIASVNCRRSLDTVVAYTDVCEIPISAISKDTPTVSLRLQILGESVLDYPIRLPEK